ncbi:Plexin domain-containing protein 2, partial [Stegodyphus mimosarum]
MFSFLYKLGLLYIFVFVQVNALEDVSQKSSSKLSDFKAKLAKTELSAKYVESDSVNLQESYDNESIADLGISVPPEHANDTLKEDHHTYYNSTFYSDPEAAKSLWVDLDSLPGNHVITHEMLSDSHRQATTVELSFDFPFYGSLLRNVTIATGGFLYTGDYLHNWIAATQYIAPLMANFDTSISTESQIKYADRSSSFVVQWNKVFIQGRMNDGPFTFQVVLKQNGDIVFGYKDVPYPISNISESHHPVKIGISDAYILETSLFFVRRKTIYEYHRIDLLKRNITNNTALYFTALPTCSSFKDCT